MQIKLKNEKNLYKTLGLLSVLALLVSLIGIFLIDIVVPVSAALVAMVILLEEKKNKPISLVLISLVCIANVLSVGLLGGFMFSGFETVILAVIIFLCFKKNVSKSETAFTLSAVAVLFIIFNAVFFAMCSKGVFDLGAVKIFYSELYSLIKEEIVSYLGAINSSLSETSSELLLSPDDVGALLDSLVSMLISFIAIAGFAVAGFALKFFTAIAYRLTLDKDILKWRFRTDSMFAYIYFALLLLQIFTMGSSDLFAIMVMNLAYIFGAVYAYIGFNFALSLLSLRRGPVFSFIILIIGFAMFSSVMIDILSVVGAFVTVTGNKALSKK